MIRLLRKLRRDQRGTAVTEFALWTTALFLVVMSAMDFAGFYMQRGQINEAVSAAAVQTFQARDNVNFQSTSGYIRNLAENQNLSVAMSCNGVANSCTNLNRTCACLKTDGTYVARTCGSVCTGAGITNGSTAGYYLTIAADQPYEPVLLPSGVMGNSDVAQSVTVRLQ